jgi:hypothetical protein
MKKKRFTLATGQLQNDAQSPAGLAYPPAFHHEGQYHVHGGDPADVFLHHQYQQQQQQLRYPPQAHQVPMFNSQEL